MDEQKNNLNRITYPRDESIDLIIFFFFVQLFKISYLSFSLSLSLSLSIYLSLSLSLSLSFSLYLSISLSVCMSVCLLPFFSYNFLYYRLYVQVSVKERFIIPESKVPSLMAGAFDLQGEVRRLKDKGKTFLFFVI